MDHFYHWVSFKKGKGDAENVYEKGVLALMRLRNTKWGVCLLQTGSITSYSVQVCCLEKYPHCSYHVILQLANQCPHWIPQWCLKNRRGKPALKGSTHHVLVVRDIISSDAHSPWGIRTGHSVQMRKLKHWVVKILTYDGQRAGIWTQFYGIRRQHCQMKYRTFRLVWISDE